MCYYIGSRSALLVPSDVRNVSPRLCHAVYTVSVLATLNAREGLRLHAEQLGQGSLRGLTGTSNTGSRRDVRAVVDTMVLLSPLSVVLLIVSAYKPFLQVPAKVVVAIQRDTTVTFDSDIDRTQSDHKHAGPDTHRRPYRYHPQSPTSSRTQFVGLLNTISSKLNSPNGSSRELDSEFGPPPRSCGGEAYPS